jgi:hypothetical protein
MALIRQDGSGCLKASLANPHQYLWPMSEWQVITNCAIKSAISLSEVSRLELVEKTSGVQALQVAEQGAGLGVIGRNSTVDTWVVDHEPFLQALLSWLIAIKPAQGKAVDDAVALAPSL